VNTILLILFSHIFSPSLNLQALYGFLLARFSVQVSPQLYSSKVKCVVENLIDGHGLPLMRKVKE
jgi:hypothetical protein